MDPNGKSSTPPPEPEKGSGDTPNPKHVRALQGIMDDMQAELMVTTPAPQIARGFVALIVTLHAIHAQTKDPAIQVQLNTTLMTLYTSHPTILPIIAKLIDIVKHERQ